jgi:hypothetical protein
MDWDDHIWLINMLWVFEINCFDYSFQVEGGFTVTAEDIVGRLNSVLQQNCNYTSTEETEN